MFYSPYFIYEHAKARQRELLEEAANLRAARLARVTAQPRTRSVAWLLAAVGRGMSDLGERLQRVQRDQRLQHELRLQRDQRLSARVASTICEICGARLDSVPGQTGGTPGGPMLTANQ